MKENFYTEISGLRNKILKDIDITTKIYEDFKNNYGATRIPECDRAKLVWGLDCNAIRCYKYMTWNIGSDISDMMTTLEMCYFAESQNIVKHQKELRSLMTKEYIKLDKPHMITNDDVTRMAKLNLNY